MLRRKWTVPIVELKRKKWEQNLGLFGNHLNDMYGSHLFTNSVAVGSQIRLKSPLFLTTLLPNIVQLAWVVMAALYCAQRAAWVRIALRTHQRK